MRPIGTTDQLSVAAYAGDMTTQQLTATPGLWQDWCAVTGTAEDQLDEATLQRFAATTGVSQRLPAVRCSVTSRSACSG